MSEAQTGGVKDAANAIIESLPEDVTWDEVQYRLYVRQQIDAGLADSRCRDDAQFPIDVMNSQSARLLHETEIRET